VPARIEIEQRDGICILHCSGGFDAGADFEQVQSKMDDIKRLNCTKVVADFSELQSLGSSGIIHANHLARHQRTGCGLARSARLEIWVCDYNPREFGRQAAVLARVPARLGTAEVNPADDRCDASDDAQRGKSFHEPGKLRRVRDP
jgi:hypothetical protein